jgi:hypothetical protein
MHPHRMDDRGSVNKTPPVGNHGCFNAQTRERARDTPVALVAGRWLLTLLLASGLGSSVGAPSRNLEISNSRISLEAMALDERAGGINKGPVPVHSLPYTDHHHQASKEGPGAFPRPRPHPAGETQLHLQALRVQLVDLAVGGAFARICRLPGGFGPPALGLRPLHALAYCGGVPDRAEGIGLSPP